MSCRRLSHLTVLLLAIPTGMVTRHPRLTGTAVGTYGGDVLWSFALYQALRTVHIGAPAVRLALACMAISTAVEMSQLYHAPWLDALRAYRPVALALGSGFLWSDLVCYGVGAAAGWGLDAVLCRARRPTGEARPPGKSA